MAGLVEFDPAGRFHNCYLTVGPEGFITKFRKLHTFINPSLSPGDSYNVIDLLGIKAGFLVCYDNNLPENVRITAMLGAEVIFMPHVTGCLPSTMPGRGTVDRALWENRERDPVRLRLEFEGPKGRGWLMRWLPARAWENGVYAVFSNAIGVDDDTIKPGLAMIIDPFGEVVEESRALGDDVVVALLTPQKLEQSSGRRYQRAPPRAVRQARRAATARSRTHHTAGLEGGTADNLGRRNRARPRFVTTPARSIRNRQEITFSPEIEGIPRMKRITVLLWAVVVPPAWSGELRVGAAAIPITPPPGIPMAGYYSERAAKGVHDDLQAKVIVLETGGATAALVALDLISTPRDLVEEARRAIERVTQVRGASVMISATHSHTGPVLDRRAHLAASQISWLATGLGCRPRLPTPFARPDHG